MYKPETSATSSNPSIVCDRNTTMIFSVIFGKRKYVIWNSCWEQQIVLVADSVGTPVVDKNIALTFNNRNINIHI